MRPPRQKGDHYAQGYATGSSHKGSSERVEIIRIQHRLGLWQDSRENVADCPPVSADFFYSSTENSM